MSSAESWNSVPLLSFQIPEIEKSMMFSSFGVSVLAALSFISASHIGNHNQASGDWLLSIRKMILQFWTPSILDRIYLSFREAYAYSKFDSSHSKHSNRVLSLWHKQSSNQYKPTYVWITVLFFVIIISNFFGLFPFFEAITGKTGMTLGLSLAVWSTVTFCGMSKLKLKFVELFLPSGLPWLMAPIFVLLEFISYTFRAISLGVRLWANMLSGHQLIHLVSAMVLVPALCLNVVSGTIVTILGAGLLMALTGLESIVCILQSGVFCLLASFYLNEALHTKNAIKPVI